MEQPHREIIIRNKHREQVGVSKVDADDYERVSVKSWSLIYGYAQTSKIGRMHRFILTGCLISFLKIIDPLIHNIPYS